MAIPCFPQNTLYENFLSPPAESHPRVWWHWLDGNITKDGIRKDLLWMQQAGIQGVHNFDVFRGTPTIVEKKIGYMTADWQKLFKYAVYLADSLGMEFTIASSPGWSETGGPWVKAENAMKKLVWREMRIEGGKPFIGSLPAPFTVSGPFQNVKIKPDGNSESSYYQDIAVLAVRLPDEDIDLKTLQPQIRCSSGILSLKEMTDDDFIKSTIIKADTTGNRWIEYVFPTSIKIASLSIADGKMRGKRDVSNPPKDRILEVSDNGRTYREITRIPNGGSFQQTVSIPETSAKYFRIRYMPDPDGKDLRVSEFKMYATPRVNHFEEKAGFAVTADDNEYPTPDIAVSPSTADVIDISNNVNKSEILHWDAPSGSWRILRIGYSLTGKTNHPAVPEATGLEVDKLDPDAIRAYYRHYLKMYKKASGGMMGAKGIQYLLNDSYEAGPQTWTRNMPEEFKKRRGYDLIKWMPVLTGQVISSGKESDQFLWDWRKTIAEMIAEYHYDLMTDILNSHQMKRYTESQELGRVYLVDGMDAKRKAAIPMSAFWMHPKNESYAYPNAEADIKESSSVAHLYGQNIAAAESFTCNGLTDGAWIYCPENLKPMADVALWHGLNRFVVHTSPHQPSDAYVPGLGLGKYGQWFDRHETWADYAKCWTDYLSRSCYMLQQGHYIADIAYYYGEDNCITGLYHHGMPADIPQGFNYDFINSDALLHLLQSDKGNLVTRSGMKYRVLVLDRNVKYMSMPVLEKIHELACNGILICGAAPQFCANLNASQEKFSRLVKDIWHTGRANVSTHLDVEHFLIRHHVDPDIEYLSASSIETRFVHRQTTDGDIYWINNYEKVPHTLTVSFRTHGKKPQVWHADTGNYEEVSYWTSGGRTSVKLNMDGYEAVFVIFIDDTSEKEHRLPEKIEIPLLTVNNPWTVSFQQGRGAPPTAQFERLQSLSESDQDGIKYFSGKVTYQTTFTLADEVEVHNTNQYIDLGTVKNIAEVYVNGNHAGVVWKAPFRLDIGQYLRKGTNKLKIVVTNLWPNRLIGDVQPHVKTPVTRTAMTYYQPDAPLLPSGLIGPVRIIEIH